MAELEFANFLKDKVKLARGQKEVFEQAIVLPERELEQKLVNAGIISEENLAKFKGEFYHIPFVSLSEIEGKLETVKGLMPPSFMESYRAVPFAKEDRKVKIALSDPTNLQTLQALEFLAKKNNWEVQLFLVTDSDLTQLMSRGPAATSQVQEAVEEFTESQANKVSSIADFSDIEKQYEERAPIAKIIDGLIAQALTQRASDIHFEPFEDRLRVRFRIDGVLREVFSFPKNAQNSIISRIKILSNMKIDESRLPQDGRFRFHWGDKKVDFRVSSFPTTAGEKIVLRLLRRADQIPSFEDLGITGRNRQAVQRAMGKSHGMFLVTGPTGSGKSTSLFVVLSQLNRPGVNIVTLEDPVEYVLAGANQAQVNPDIGFTFASGLRSILRQDPNIILVGEIRDTETAELAVHSALTGHLVFSTLHTNSAVGALPRLVDMGVEPFLIVASVNVVMAQRLVRVICPDCKTEVPVSKEVVQLLINELKDIADIKMEGIDLEKPKLYIGKGCKKCGDIGYVGRIGIYESFEMSKQMGDAIVSKAPPSKLIEIAHSQGMLSLKQDGFIKVLNGITTIEEVLRETRE